MAQSKSGLESNLPAQSYHNHGSEYSGSKPVTSQNLKVPSSHRPRPSVDSTCSELSIFSNKLSGPGQALLDESLPDGLPGPEQRPGLLEAFWFRNKGAIYVLLSQLFGSGMNLATRILENPGGHGRGMHPFQLLFVRMFVTCVLSMLYMWYTRVPYFPLGSKDVRGLLVFRGLAGFFGVCGLYYSLVYLPISEAVVLTFLAPMLSCYAYSFIQPSESFTRQQQIGACVSIVGVILIAQPFSFSSSTAPADSPIALNSTSPEAIPTSQPFSSPSMPTTSQHLYAIALALMGVCGGACALTTIRYIGRRAHPLISINYFATWCTIVSLFSFAVIPGVGFKLPENIVEWSLLLFVGVNGFFMQVFLTAGLAYSTNNSSAPGSKPKPSSATSTTSTTTSSSGSRAASMLYTQMLFALFFDKIVWDLTPNIWSWVGSGLILGSVIWVSVVKDKDITKEPSKTTMQYHFNNYEEEEELEMTTTATARESGEGEEMKRLITEDQGEDVI